MWRCACSWATSRWAREEFLWMWVKLPSQWWMPGIFMICFQRDFTVASVSLCVPCVRVSCVPVSPCPCVLMALSGPCLVSVTCRKWLQQSWLRLEATRLKGRPRMPRARRRRQQKLQQRSRAKGRPRRQLRRRKGKTSRCALHHW